MRAIAIDFETANQSRGSACALGLVWIEGLMIVRQEYRLIRPKIMDFHPINVGVHGIRPADVRAAAEFPDVYAEFKDDFEDAILIAHNMSFDLAVLHAAGADYGLPIGRLGTFCTLRMARHLWPSYGTFKLSSLALRHQIAFRHHHAGDDAYACARLAIDGAKTAGSADILDLARRTRLLQHAPPRSAVRRPTEGSIASRALAGLNSARQGSERTFEVRGSTGNLYTVTMHGEGKSAVYRCNCTAGRFHRSCKHVRAIFPG